MRLSLIVVMLVQVQLMVAEERDQISQYGVTWHFDKAYEVGQFITGDWWVLGPVTVTKVDPQAGPVENASFQVKKNMYGVSGLKNDNQMRNGSMIVETFSRKQGYDSRILNYDASLSQTFPLTLKVNQSLVSSISHETPQGMNLAHPIMWKSEKKARYALKCAAVLTVLEKAPPADAFRPAYAGTNKKIFQEKDIQWDLLLNLEPAEGRPDWQQLARYFERPWIDHTATWLLQVMGPEENNANYGREVTRLGGLVGLALMTKASKEEKRKALIGLLQYGIDIQGFLDSGQNWMADGGHYSGRKFPLLFAGMLLNDETMQNPSRDIRFQEDQDTYYGTGWAGQKVLWQMTTHTGPRPPYEELPPEKWDKFDKRSEGYRTCCNGKAWIATALTMRLMKGIKTWNHDAYFDYCDRWMRKDDPYAAARGKHKRPKAEGSAFDAFATNMWRTYRDQAPKQEFAGNNRKWVWTMDGRKAQKPGQWVENPRPDDL